MTSIQVAKEVMNDQSCRLARRRADDTFTPDGKVIPQYDVKEAFTGKKKGWFYVDLFTASAIMAVYEALSPEMKEKAPRIPLTKLAEFAFGAVRS